MIGQALADHGLLPRGGFDFAANEEAPAGPNGVPARAVLLVGHAGDAHWPHFRKWLATQPENPENPLDTWSREVIGAVARACGARAVSPSDRPYLPFQQWAMRAEGLRPSPLGILMHPEYGLWHAYRGALLFDAPLGLTTPRMPHHPCDTCDGKPCLKTCPVEAYSPAGFTYGECLSHVRGPRGSVCRQGGCLARNSCPYGESYRYRPEVQAFHMQAFLHP